MCCRNRQSGPAWTRNPAFERLFDLKRMLPEKDVALRYGVCRETLRRWDADAPLGFPPAIRIKGRKYRDEALLDAFDERMCPNGKESKSGH
jgi:hypothetical protein